MFSDIGADVLDLSGSKLEFGDDLKLEPVSDNKINVLNIIKLYNVQKSCNVYIIMSPSKKYSLIIHSIMTLASMVVQVIFI